MTSTGPKKQELSYLNFPIQSAGVAWLMFTIFKMPSWVKIVLTTHDGLIVEGPPDAEHDIRQAVLGAMDGALKQLFPDVKLRVDVQSGFRYFKKSQSSLHDFCASLGLNLPTPVIP